MKNIKGIMLMSKDGQKVFINTEVYEYGGMQSRLPEFEGDLPKTFINLLHKTSGKPAPIVVNLAFDEVWEQITKQVE